MSKNPTVGQLVAAAQQIVPSFDEATIKVMMKEHNVRSFKRVKEVFSKVVVEVAPVAPAEPAKTPRYRSERIIEAGPRGFRFSDKWNESVKSGSGIAVHPSNFPKLMAQADAAGVLVNVTELTSTTLAAAIAATL